jgi:hypothetical protein
MRSPRCTFSRRPTNPKREKGSIMKEEAKPEKWIKTLAQLEEELHPEGEKVPKDEMLQEDLEIQRIKPWKKAGKQNVRVTAIRVSTGELVVFNGGEPMYDAVKDHIESVPFVAQLGKYPSSTGHDYYILE